MIAQAMPGIRRKIVNGDTAGAVAAMNALGIAPGLQRYYIAQTLQPHETRRQIADFQRGASAEERTRVGLMSQ
jgi:23S rRNA G2445 N2-methylase RlmL